MPFTGNPWLGQIRTRFILAGGAILWIVVISAIAGVYHLIF